MPKILLPLQGVKETFSRPVVVEVVRDLIAWTGLPKNIAIQFPGDKEVIHQKGSSIDPQQGHNTYDESTRLFITYDDDYEEDFLSTTAVFRPDHPHYFFDKETRTFMRPVYSRNRIRINIRFQASDKGAAEKWRDEFRARIAHDRFNTYHNPTYSYYVPKEYVEILREIHRLRENHNQSGQSFEEFFKEYSTKRITDVTDQAGKNHEWAIRETQARVNGSFEFDTVPEKPSRAQDGTSFNIEFTYNLIIDKPIATVMTYELVVHNQPLPKKFVLSQSQKTMEQMDISFSISNRLFFAGETEAFVDQIVEPGCKYPDYDEWVPNFVYPHTLRIFTGLTLVDKVDKKTLLNLEDLGAYKLNPTVIAYCKRNHQRLGEYAKAMINVCVYENENPMGKTQFSIDSNLNVALINESDMKKIYHVRISLYTNPLLLPRDAWDDLLSDYTSSKLLLEHAAPGCIEHNPLKKLSTNHLSSASLRKLAECRYQRATVFATAGDPLFWALQSTLAIKAH